MAKKHITVRVRGTASTRTTIRRAIQTRSTTTVVPLRTFPAFLPALPSQEPTMTTINQGPVFHEAVTGSQLAMTGGVITHSTIHIADTDLDVDQLRQLANHVLDHLDELAPDPAARAAATEAAETVLAETDTSQPDQSRIHRALAKLSVALVPAATGAASGAAAEAAKAILITLANLL